MLKPLESSSLIPSISLFMETKSSITSTSLILGLIFTLHALLVQSQPLNGRSPAPLMSPPPSPPPPPPLPAPPPSPLSPPLQSSPAPSRKKLQPPPLLRLRLTINENRRRRHPPPPPPIKNHKMNTGKSIGLLFVGIAAILQIGVVGFLVYKRRQLLKIKDRYENYSA